jgi:hypothetical protein
MLYLFDSVFIKLFCYGVFAVMPAEWQRRFATRERGEKAHIVPNAEQ